MAERAGVSVASVSRVLNGLASSDAMAARVLAAADELGYRPNAMARSLKMQRTGQLALAVADVGNPVYVDMMRAVETEAKAEGYRLVLASTGADPDAVVAVLRSLDHNYADGLILSPLRVTAEVVAALRATRVPTVVVGQIPADVPVDNVRVNSAGGVRLAVEHLHGAGRRRIAFVNGPIDTVPGRSRARGFEATMRRLAIDSEPDLRVEADDFTLEAGHKVVGEMLDRARPDAVLGANDLLAIATMQALRERGLSVPGDVAVVGMDDTELAMVTSPPLSSVALGSTQRGRFAARLLLERLRDRDRKPHRLTVQPSLHIRSSSDDALARTGAHQ